MARLAADSLELAPGFNVFDAIRAGIPMDEWEETKAMKALMARSDALPEGEVVGGVIRFPWADGYAVYVVTSARPLTLQHVAFGDAWTVPAYMIDGLKKADILAMLDRERRLAALFAEH